MQIQKPRIAGCPQCSHFIVMSPRHNTSLNTDAVDKAACAG